MDPLTNLIQSIHKCYNYGSIYALEEKFNEVGLTIQQTVSNRMLLCKIEDGRPFAEELFKDYMFVGSERDFDTEIPAKLVECVVEFVHSTASKPESIRDLQGQLTQHLATYGKIIVDDIGYIMQNEGLDNTQVADKRIGVILDAMGATQDEDLLTSLKNWLNEHVGDELIDDEIQKIHESTVDLGDITADLGDIDDLLQGLEG